VRPQSAQSDDPQSALYKQMPPKVEYSLTELGRTLIPILLNMREWGVDYEAYLGGETLFSGEEYEPRDQIEIGK
jgi:DNA-binding HxlR family transcriptional regulator